MITSDETAGTASLGIVGLGAMGAPMAHRLVEAHGSLHFYARSAKDDLESAGATRVTTPKELAERCTTIISVLPDLPELEAVLEGPEGVLAGAGDLLLIIASTSSAAAVRELGERLHDLSDGRVRVVDAPVSGGVDGARAGTLAIMMGGTEEDAAQAARFLSPCGRPVRLGPLGSGEVAKACNQLVVSATILALGEATVLADRAGLDLETLWSLLAEGYAGSRVLETRKDKLVTGDDSPSGMAQYMVKDLRFAGDVATMTATNPVLLPTLKEAFDGIVDAGLGDRDIAVTRRYIAGRDSQ